MTDPAYLLAIPFALVPVYAWLRFARTPSRYKPPCPRAGERF